MSVVEIALWSWVAFLGGILIFSLIYKPDPVEAFREQCRSQGMDFKETQAALAIRYHFVRVRRLASDLCLERHGEMEASHIGDLIAAEARVLHLLHGFQAAKSFVAWANACPEHEVLYADAQAVRMQYFNDKIRDFPKREPDPQLLEDLRAAVTILR